MQERWNELSELLIDFHKELVTFQSKLVEKEDGVVYNPYQLFQLVSQDLRFDWIRKMARLIVKMDEISFRSNENYFLGMQQILQEIQQLFIEKETEIEKKIEAATHWNPNVLVRKIAAEKFLQEILEDLRDTFN